MIAFVSDMPGKGIYPPFPFAHHLFLDVVRINDLRAQTAGDAVQPEVEQHNSNSARALLLLDHITSFSPEQWADTNAGDKPVFRDMWLVLGRIYHSAVALFCISSLQSLGVLPTTAKLRTCRVQHRDHLMVLLDDGLKSTLLKRNLPWPLIVAGFEAAEGSETEQTFVARWLEEQSRELGSSLPLVAKSVLARFWCSQKTGWDDCFDRPYAFLI